MSETERARRADAILMTVVVLIGAMALYLARQLPPSRFDPLGPGSVPAWIGLGLVLAGGVGLAQLAFGRALGRAETSLVLGLDGEAEHQRHPKLAAAVLALVVLYCLVLHYAPVGFFAPTFAFIAAAAVLMSRSLAPRRIATALVVGALCAGALSWIFGQALRVVLP